MNEIREEFLVRLWRAEELVKDALCDAFGLRLGVV